MTKDPIRSWAERYNLERGEGPSARSLAAQRAHLLLEHSRRRQTPRRVPFWAYAAALAAVGAALVVLGARGTFSPEAARFRGERIAAGVVLEAASVRERVEIPGGSVMDLEAHARARLGELSPKRVEWTVLDGEVAFDVNRKAGADWTIHAGPYRVQVLGTAFVVNVDRARSAVSVSVQRGTVSVEGPNIPPGVRLTAGQSFDSSTHLATTQPSALPLSPTAEASGNPTLALEEVSPPEGTRTEPRRGGPSRTWQALARSGDYAGAFALVKKIGFDGTLARANGDERILLGNAARFSGDRAAAERAYLGARASPSPASKSLAAYYLARVALDEHRSPGEAIGWLRTFLREAPNGELAPSARARLMGLLDRSGDSAGARQLAREYLRLHPNGPHASLAQSLTREESR